MSHQLYLIIVLLAVRTFVDGAPVNEAAILNDKLVIDDMELTPQQHAFLFSDDPSKRHGMNNPIKRWPDGIFTYKFEDNLGKNVQQMILKAMSYISSISCIKFEKVKGDENHVMFKNSRGCASYVGNLNKGKQEIQLSPNCGFGGTIHEILHTLGLLHMHTSVDRDDYLKIDYRNIVPNFYKNFEKYQAYSTMFGTEYDYNSIMHYPQNAYAINHKEPTFIPLKIVKGRIGQRKEMSKGDIQRLNNMYRCSQQGSKNDEPADDEVESEAPENFDYEEVTDKKTLANPLEVKKLSQDMYQLMSPVCDFKARLKKILTEFRRMGV